MDPLSLTVALFSVASISKNVFVLIRELSQATDPKYLSMKAKLLAQEKRFTNWSVWMHVASLEEIEAVIKKEDRRIIRDLWMHVTRFFEQAQRRIESLDLRKRQIQSRLVWLWGGYDELKEILEAIKDINDALYAVAEPPPKYDGQFSTPVPHEHTGRSQHDARQTISTPISTPLVVQRRRKTLWQLHSRCLHALTGVSSQMSRANRIGDIEFRLQNWASAFLDGHLNLDELLIKEEGGERVHELLRETIVGTFVDIALVEVKLLGMFKGESRSEKRGLEESQLQLLAILGVDEVVDIAINRPAPKIDEYLELDKIEDVRLGSIQTDGSQMEGPQTSILPLPSPQIEGPGLDSAGIAVGERHDHQENSGAALAPPQAQRNTFDETLDAGLCCIETATHDLYDLLPAIRNLRRAELLERQQRSKLQALGRPDTVTTSIKASDLTTTSILVGSTVKDAKRIVETLDQEADAEDVSSTMARLIKKESERLQEWGSNIGIDTLGEEREAQVQNILKDLKLEFAQADISHKTSIASGMGDQSSGKGIAKSVEGNKHMKDVLDQFRKANEKLLDLTHSR